MKQVTTVNLLGENEAQQENQTKLNPITAINQNLVKNRIKSKPGSNNHKGNTSNEYNCLNSSFRID